jgi:PAS domain S-box-containing protein
MQFDMKSLLLRHVLRNLPLCLLVVDREGQLVGFEGVPPPALAIEPSQLSQNTLYLLFQNIPQVIEEYHKALDGRETFCIAEIKGFELDIWYSPLLNEQQQVIGASMLVIDVTERRRAEDLMQYQANLLQSVSDSIITTDTDWSIQTWNAASELLYGWRVDEVLGKPLHDVICSSYATGNIDEILARVIEQRYWQGEATQRRKDGSVILVLSSISLLEDETGAPSGFVLVSRDFTERQRAEQQKIELAVEKEKVRLLREFISEASHDFRTPITAIIGSLYLLQKKNPEIGGRYLDDIATQVNNLKGLVENLLTLSRLEGGSKVLNFSSVNLNDLINDIVAQLRSLAYQKKQTISVLLKPNPPLIQADPVELGRAITNLLTNAINYTSEGGAIHLTTDGNHDEVVIRVGDNGIGIDPKDLPHIFERFYRSRSSQSRRPGGSGLGLAIVKRIVESHQGRVAVKSVLGEGSTFEIMLPVHICE